MGNARFLDQPADLEKLGLKPGVVQKWEDGRQGKIGTPEVWYFDAVMDDGTKFVGGFRTRPGMNKDKVDDPMVIITVTTPDGTAYADTNTYPVEEATIGRGVECEFRCGPHYVTGDLKDYHLHIEPIIRDSINTTATDGMACTTIKGVGVDLYLHAEVPPFRHGAGRTQFDDDDERFSSWLSIPKLTVTGTVTVEGDTYAVTGLGYHDHRCMAVQDFECWHHWLWGRQTFDEHTVVIYDLVAAKKYGYLQVPLFGIYNKEGQLIFDNDGTLEAQITERYFDEKTKKEYPKTVIYTLSSEEMKIKYTLSWTEILEIRAFYEDGTDQMRAAFDMMGIQPSYLRHFSNGTLEITDANGTSHEEGTMIYEFAYVGKPDPDAHL